MPGTDGRGGSGGRAAAGTPPSFCCVVANSRRETLAPSASTLLPAVAVVVAVDSAALRASQSWCSQSTWMLCDAQLLRESRRLRPPGAPRPRPPSRDSPSCSYGRLLAACGRAPAGGETGCRDIRLNKTKHEITLKQKGSNAGR